MLGKWLLEGSHATRLEFGKEVEVTETGRFGEKGRIGRRPAPPSSWPGHLHLLPSSFTDHSSLSASSRLLLSVPASTYLLFFFCRFLFTEMEMRIEPDRHCLRGLFFLPSNTTNGQAKRHVCKWGQVRRGGRQVLPPSAAALIDYHHQPSPSRRFSARPPAFFTPASSHCLSFSTFSPLPA